MTARLMAVAGPREGKTFRLPDGEFTIGRDAGNDLCVAADDRVSRRHAAIVERDQQFTIRDLTERGRTLYQSAAGRRTGARARRRDSDGPVRVPVSRRWAARSRACLRQSSWTRDLRWADPIVRPAKAIRCISTGRRSSNRSRTMIDRRVVQSVLAACQAVLSTRALHDLQRQLIATILEATPAERAAILLVGDQSDTFASALHWTRRGGECSVIPHSSRRDSACAHRERRALHQRCLVHRLVVANRRAGAIDVDARGAAGRIHGRPRRHLRGSEQPDGALWRARLFDC